MSQAESNLSSAAQRRAQLAALLRQNASSGHPEPLSEGQRALWYMSELDPENASLNLGEAVRVRGGLERGAFARALAKLLSRHELLRTRLVVLSGEPFQVVHTASDLPLESLVVADETEDGLGTAAGAFIDRRFDLQRQPPCRFALRRLASGDDLLVFALHHVAGELASLFILIGELLELYRSEKSGTPPLLASLDARYHDFVVAQGQYLRGPRAIRDSEYWRRQLEQAPDCISLAPPGDARAVPGSCLVSFELPATTTRAVRELSRKLDVSAYVTLLSAFALLQARRVGARDLVVGAPMTGRAEARFENVIGYFDNPVPLRLVLPEGARVRDVVRLVREAVLGAVEHQAYPLQRIVEDSRSRAAGRVGALFNTLFVMRQTPRRALQALTCFGMGESRASAQLSELSVESVPLRRGRSQFELALSIAEADGRLMGSWELDRSRFPPEAVEDISCAFAKLLAALVQDPDGEVDALPALSDREERWLIQGCNDTTKDLGPPALLQDGVERWVEATPESVAVVAANARLRYADLDRLADGVAQRLRALGLRAGEHVAIVMRKGWEQVVAVLGVLRAGGAYVPVDAKLPERRRDDVLARAGARVALTQTQWLNGPWPQSVSPVDVTTLGPSTAAVDRPPAAPTDLAYTIFTSGSTGEPKGVMISHQGAVNTLRDVNERLHTAPGDVVLGLSALSFDLSVYDIFGTLGAGATLVLPDAERLYEPAHWVELLRAHRVTIWNSVPSLLKLAFEQVEGSAADQRVALRSLRALLLSGDWIGLDLPARAKELCGSHRFISMGGATEGSVWSIWFEVDAPNPAWTSIPYGRPMANQEIHILDAHGRPCPTGVIGEIHIGGVGVMMGYWQAPDLSARALVRSPAVPGLLYKTGDLGRRFADGVVEFLGRADFQVKVRGFRVETGEVEVALSRHPAVDAVVVTARRAGDENQLVAYVVARGVVTAQELRAEVASALPEYMVPARWVFLPKLPLSANGKVDRNALPEPNARSSTPAPSAAVGSEEEQVLVEAVATTLGLETVCLEDDLIALGADSVHVIRLATRLQQSGYAVSSRDLFERTGLRELLRLMTLRRGVGPERAPTLPWQRACLERGEPAPYRCRLDSPRSLEAARVRDAWARLVERHEALRLVVRDGEQWPCDEPTLRTRQRVDSAVSIEGAALAHGSREEPRLTLSELADGSSLLLDVPRTMTDADGFRALVAELAWALSDRRPAPPRTGSMLAWASALAQTASGVAPALAGGSPPTRAFATLECDARQAQLVAVRHRLSLSELVALALDRSLVQPETLALVARHAGVHDAPLVSPAAHERWVRIGDDGELVPLRRLERLRLSSPGLSRPGIAAIVIERSEVDSALAAAGLRAARWTEPAVADRGEPCVLLVELVADASGGVDQLRWHCWSSLPETPETTLSRVSTALAEVLRELALATPKNDPEHFPLATLSSSSLERLGARYPGFQDVWDLAPMQQTMLLHGSVDGDPGLYCHHLRWDVHGALDSERLFGAFERLLITLPNLRVAFEPEDAEVPVQVVLPLRALPFREVRVTAEELDAAMELQIASDRARGFDLRRPPLLRVVLFRVSPQRARLLLCHHHLLFDGWSVASLQQLLLVAYEGAALPSGGADYTDFLRFCRTQPAAPRLDYWRRLLAGVKATTPLGFQDRRDFGRFQHRELELRWDPSLTASLEVAARVGRVTVGSVLLAAWGVLLARYAERDEAVFGVTGSGRPEALAGAEDIVGLLINTVPLRVTLREDATLLELIRELQAQYAESRLHEQTSLRALSELVSMRDFRPFDTVVIFENFASGGRVSDACPRFEPFEFTEQTNAPVALYVLPGAEWKIRVNFDGSRFEPSTIERLLAQLRRCVEAFVRDAGQPLASLSLSPAPEADRLRAFNSNRREWHSTATISELLSEQARVRPSSLALCDHHRRWSYSELDARVSQWASALRDRGVSTGDRVALACRRSAEWIIALYAVLRAGACYVPLDDASPAERNRGILEDADVRLILSDRSTAESLGATEVPVLLVDIEDLTASATDAGGLPTLQPTSPAYVIYTSGSTGTPKGVVVSHGAVVNYALGTRSTYEFCPQDRILQCFSPAFDGAGEEIFGALAAGAALVLRDEQSLASFSRFAAYLREEAVTVVDLPTAVWHAWVADLERTGEALPEGLRCVVIGGERALPARVAAWRRLAGDGGPRLFNSYGPTEATIVTLVSELTAWDETAETGRELPIGRPVPNVSAYVVDARGRLCLEGAPGELLIGGAGLADGYLNRPELTSQRFVELPCLPGVRLYRSGDRVRFRGDAQLEFLGRLDEQVKVRGYRVELGEIEGVIRSCRGVRDAVVKTVPSGDDHRLVAYVVPSDAGSELDPGLVPRLREELLGRLASYMLPAVIVPLEALPLNERGKLDRSRLPEPELAPTTEPKRPPRTDQERAIARIWGEVLGLDAVDVECDFFSAGGHSLAALRLLGRLQQELGVRCSLRELYARPTVAGLASLGESGASRASTSPKARMQSDAALALPLRFPTSADASSPTAILLTGATGFLGTFLLAEALATTSARIFCLARDGHLAFARIERALRAAGEWRDDAVARIELIKGDLAEPRLGIDVAEYDRLATCVNCVIHNGAQVSFVDPYEALRGPNVLGTRDILQLCATGRPKSLHYVSTLAVFDPNEAADTLPEQWLGDVPAELPSGYGQSKWVAERLVTRALQAGLRGVVYRPGRISGHSRTGAWQREDLACLMIAACAAVGGVPDLEMAVDLTPVDFVAKAIVTSILRGDSSPPLHLTNRRGAGLEQVCSMLRGKGLQLSRMSVAKWAAAVSGKVEGDSQHPWLHLTTLLALWQESLRPPRHGAASFATTHTEALLSERGITCPPLDGELVGTYLHWMKRVGMLEQEVRA